ncbi:hypothetical protein [Paenibacillus periandrae]|uniref:hypothetical protein n=1 Tax=Paenibacillus periandrae TaxID=1761741 RepID=UPI0030845F9D
MTGGSFDEHGGNLGCFEAEGSAAFGKGGIPRYIIMNAFYAVDGQSLLWNTSIFHGLMPFLFNGVVIKLLNSYHTTKPPIAGITIFRYDM